MSEHGPRTPREIPQIRPESGLSADYLNEVQGVRITLQMVESGAYTSTEAINQLRQIIRRHKGKLVRSYEERFADYQKPHLTPGQAQRIAAINELADKCNQLSEGTLSPQNKGRSIQKIQQLQSQLFPLIDQIIAIVEGKENP